MNIRMNFLGDDTTVTADPNTTAKIIEQVRKQAEYEQELAAQAEYCSPGIGRKTQHMKQWNKIAGWSMLGLIAANIFTRKKKKG